MSEIQINLNKTLLEVKNLVNASSVHLFLLITLMFILAVSIMSVLKLSYQIAFMAIKLIFMILLSLLEFVVILALLYPSKFTHNLIMILEYIFRKIIISFLEKRVSRSIWLNSIACIGKVIYQYIINMFSCQDQENPAIAENFDDRVHIY